MHISRSFRGNDQYIMRACTGSGILWYLSSILWKGMCSATTLAHISNSVSGEKRFIIIDECILVWVRIGIPRGNLVLLLSKWLKIVGVYNIFQYHFITQYNCNCSSTGNRSSSSRVDLSYKDIHVVMVEDIINSARRHTHSIHTTHTHTIGQF